MKYFHKRTEVEAMQCTGENGAEICAWANSPTVRFETWQGEHVILIDGGRGVDSAKSGSFVIRNAKGNFYSMSPECFAVNYEEQSELEARISDRLAQIESGQVEAPAGGQIRGDQVSDETRDSSSETDPGVDGPQSVSAPGADIHPQEPVDNSGTADQSPDEDEAK